MPWERRVRPAPSVKNSGAAGATASSCCCGAGASRRPGPRFGDRKGSWRGWGGGEGTYPAQEGMSFPECEYELPQPAVLGVSPPILGGLLVPDCLTLRGPDPGILISGCGFEPSSTPDCATEPPGPHPHPPIQAPGELRSNLTKLVAGFTGLYLSVRRGPGSPAARSCWVLQAVPPPPRAAPRAGPAPPPWLGEEPRPRPVEPRPVRAAPGSPPQGLGR